MSLEPFDSRAKTLPPKRSDKGYGDENALIPVILTGRLGTKTPVVNTR